MYLMVLVGGLVRQVSRVGLHTWYRKCFCETVSSRLQRIKVSSPSGMFVALRSQGPS